MLRGKMFLVAWEKKKKKNINRTVLKAAVLKAWEKSSSL